MMSSGKPSATIVSGTGSFERLSNTQNNLIQGSSSMGGLYSWYLIPASFTQSMKGSYDRQVFIVTGLSIRFEVHAPDGRRETGTATRNSTRVTLLSRVYRRRLRGRSAPDERGRHSRTDGPCRDGRGGSDVASTSQDQESGRMRDDNANKR